MTLDEAIKHCLEVAEENDLAAGTYELLAENNHNAYEKLTAETNSSRCAECATEHRQLAEWLTDYKELKNSVGAVKLKDMKEAVGLLQELNAENDQLTSQLVEAKRLLKLAVDDMYNSVNDVHCKYCSKWHTDQCQGTSHLDCYVENKFKWRYTAEALALIGEDGDTNG